MEANAGTVKLPSDLRDHAQRLTDALGPRQAAARYGVSIIALCRGLAGARVRRGTVAQMRLAVGIETTTKKGPRK